MQILGNPTQDVRLGSRYGGTWEFTIPPGGIVRGMAHSHHSPPAGPVLTRLAVSATLHCLTGCAIGEVLTPLVLAKWWG